MISEGRGWRGKRANVPKLAGTRMGLILLHAVSRSFQLLQFFQSKSVLVSVKSTVQEVGTGGTFSRCLVMAFFHVAFLS